MVTAVKKMVCSGVLGKVIDLKVRPLINFESNVLYVDTKLRVNMSLAKIRIIMTCS